jgi:hypothetical protein
MSSRTDPQPGGTARWDLDLQPPVAVVAGTWDDGGRALTRALVLGGFRVLGPTPGTGADAPQLVVLPADADPAEVLGTGAEVTGRSVRCRLVGSAVGPGADPGPGSPAEVRMVLLDTGTWAQQEAAAGGLAAVVGVLLTQVLTAVGRPAGSRGR